jgi:peptidoglycan/xylan/chitin deacetylase (PgdA/CDA1 family)
MGCTQAWEGLWWSVEKDAHAPCLPPLPLQRMDGLVQLACWLLSCVGGIRGVAPLLRWLQPHLRHVTYALPVAPAAPPAPAPAPAPVPVALTIDDAPGSVDETGRVLDVLRECGHRATFFVISGLVTPERRPLVQRMVAEGHELGNHMAIDARTTGWSPERFERDLLACEAVLQVWRVGSRGGGGGGGLLIPSWLVAPSWRTRAVLARRRRHCSSRRRGSLCHRGSSRRRSSGTACPIPPFLPARKQELQPRAPGAWRWFRPPSGALAAWQVPILHRHRFRIALGDVYPLDVSLSAAPATMAWAVRWVLSHSQPGSIVILHCPDAGARGRAHLIHLVTGVARGYAGRGGSAAEAADSAALLTGAAGGSRFVTLTQGMGELRGDRPSA